MNETADTQPTGIRRSLIWLFDSRSGESPDSLQMYRALVGFARTGNLVRLCEEHADAVLDTVITKVGEKCRQVALEGFKATDHKLLRQERYRVARSVAIVCELILKGDDGDLLKVATLRPLSKADAERRVNADRAGDLQARRSAALLWYWNYRPGVPYSERAIRRILKDGARQDFVDAIRDYMNTANVAVESWVGDISDACAAHTTRTEYPDGLSVTEPVVANDSVRTTGPRTMFTPDDEPGDPDNVDTYGPAISWFKTHAPQIGRTALRISLGLMPPVSLGLLVLFANLLPPSVNATFWPIHRWIIEHFMLEIVVAQFIGIGAFTLAFWRLCLGMVASFLAVSTVILFAVVGITLYDTETRAGEWLATKTLGWPSAFSDDFDSVERCHNSPQPAAEDPLKRRYTFDCFTAGSALHMAIASGETVAAEGYLAAANIPLLRNAVAETVYRAENGSALASCGLLVSGTDRQLFVRLRPVRTADASQAAPLMYYVAEVLELSRPASLPFESRSDERSARVIVASPQLGFVDRRAIYGRGRPGTLMNIEVAASRITVYVERRKVLELEHEMTEIRVTTGVLADTPLTNASCAFDYIRTRVQAA